MPTAVETYDALDEAWRVALAEVWASWAGAFWLRDGPIVDAHRRLRPQHLDLALDVVHDEQLGRIAREGGTVRDALSAMWETLTSLT
jgi:hypothetical protein